MISNKKKTKPPSATAFTGTQLSLFQGFLCNTENERDKLSNTIELWDGVPKYFMSRQDMNRLRDSKGFLQTLERDFQYRGCTFKVRIRPARLTDENGKDKEFYPSAREELVEDALRKIATEQGCGFLENRESSGVIFTLYMLRKELKRRGHTLSYQEVIESLDIMSGVITEIHASDGKGDYKSPILAALTRVSRSEYRDDPKARWVAFFNPLVTESIYALTYRQYDYRTMMSHTTQLSRWLHKRLAHNYDNAHVMHPYKVLFSSVQRDSGLLEYSRLRDAVRKLDESLTELQSNQVILSFEKEDRRGERRQILDVAYKLIPNPDFVKHVKAANRRLADSRQKMDQTKS